MPDKTPYMLYVASHGTDDAMRSGLVMRAAIAAAKQQTGSRVALLGNSIFLMKDSIAEKVKVTVAESRVPFQQKTQTMREVIQEAVSLGVLFYV